MAKSTGPVETKVTVASVTAFITAGVLWLLGQYVFHGDVPAPLSGLILAAVTGVVTFAAAWFARHTPRNDADAVTKR